MDFYFKSRLLRSVFIGIPLVCSVWVFMSGELYIKGWYASGVAVRFFGLVIFGYFSRAFYRHVIQRDE